MITEDDDDTHICLKCHTTITGLDNYIAHRKSSCTTQASGSKPRSPSPLIPADEQDFSLKADDFFSLLELQSSSKKSSIPGTSSGKSNSGVLTRSKATAVLQANLHRGSDWIGGHQLRELGNEDNQTRLIKAVDNISGNIKKDEHIELSKSTTLNYEPMLDEDTDDEFQDDDEEDEEFDEGHGPPRTHTGGKWKPSISPIQWMSAQPSTSQVTWNPPPSHTGGKWKPQLPHLVEDDVQDKTIPPPNHTKGKWMPLEPTQTLEDFQPLRKSCGTVQYWCGPCNRRLASKIVYERHLKSELHNKRTLHEREFEDNSTSLTQKTSSRRRKHNKKQETVTKLRTKKRLYIKCICNSKVLPHLMGKHLISHYHCTRRTSGSQQMVLEHIHDIVLQSPFQCGLCRFFCNEQNDFLLHWRSKEHVDASNIKHGMFLCSYCKHQTADNKEMEGHLLSDGHKEVIAVINKSVCIIIQHIVPINCSSCNKQFRYNIELRKHCLKLNHTLNETSSDAYQQIHYCPSCKATPRSYKSLQRHLLKKHGKNFFFCSFCSITFESHLESKVHRKSTAHRNAVFAKNSEKMSYCKNLMRQCQYCYMKFENIVVLKQHLKQEHPGCCYSCPHCGLKFTLSQEVTQHIKSKSCIFPSSSSTISFFNCEKCPYNTNTEADFLFHLALHTHPLPVECPAAGSAGSAGGNKGISSRNVEMYKCPICEKILRKASLRCHVRQHTNDRPYKCDKCKSAYTRKSNLLDHVKAKHREEYKKQKFEANQEDVLDNFIKSSLPQQPHETNEDQVKSEKKHEQAREKTYLCAHCGQSFLKKYTLQQHSCVHSGSKTFECKYTGCIYRGRSAAEVKNHAVSHENVKPFICTQCEFQTKTKAQLKRHVKIHDSDEGKKHTCPFCKFSARIRSHLKRHLRLHTGAKPYRCPHCSYSCNNLENLRKHVISTNKHPGKFIYTCSWCEPPEKDFATNFAKEFQSHLVHEHSDLFDAAKAKEVTSRLLGIYNKEEDEKTAPESTCNSKRTASTTSQPAVGALPPSGTSLLPSTSQPAPSTSQLVPSTSVELLDPSLLALVVVQNDVVLVSGETWPLETLYGVGGPNLVTYEDEGGMLDEEDFQENQ